MASKVKLPHFEHPDGTVKLVKGDPRIDGPYLDDVRAEQEENYRKARMDALKKTEKAKKPAKKAAVKKTAKGAAAKTVESSKGAKGTGKK